MNPTSRAQKGKFSMTSGDKTWKFTLDDSENAVIFAEKLKNQKTIELTLAAFEQKRNGEIEDQYFASEASFGFVGNPSDTPWNKEYFISATDLGGREFFSIILKTKDDEMKFDKIGEIVEGMNEPSDLTSLFEQKGNGNSVEFTFSYEEETEESNKSSYHCNCNNNLFAIIFALLLIISLIMK